MNGKHCSAQCSVQLSLWESMSQPLRRCLACKESQEGKSSPWLPQGHSQSPHQNFQETRIFLPAGHCSVHLPSKPYLILQQPLIPEASGLLGSKSFLLGSCHASSITNWFSKLFSLTYPALNFPVQLKANTDRVCQLVSNRPEKEKPECTNCSMFLCWINNTLKKTVTLFQGTFLSIKIHNLQTLQFFTYPQRPQQKPLQDIAAKIHTLSQWVGGTLRFLSGQNHCWLHLLRNSHFQKALQKPLSIMNRQEKKVLGCGSYKPWRQHM